MTIKLLYAETREIYGLGKIIRSYSTCGEFRPNVEIDVCVAYDKVTLQRDSKFVLGEHLGFENVSGARHEYFILHDIYSSKMSKWTDKKGKVIRELRLRDYQTRKPLDLTEWDDDIVQKLRELPPHVRNVVGL